MALSLAWRNFRRMQDLTLGFASLAFAADAILAWPVLPGSVTLKLAVIVGFPAFYLVAVAAAGLLVPPLRRALTRFVWMSFKAGFGQSVLSVLISVAALTLVTFYTWWVSQGAAHGGQYPAGVFSGFGAGIGILVVQTRLTHLLERDPEVQKELGG